MNIRIITGLVILICFTPHLIGATSGKFTYRDNGTSITITGYPAAAVGEVIIPSKIVNKPVTIIGVQAFAGCSMTSVSIPSSVTSIQTEAFNYCTDLVSLNISSGVTSIASDAFSSCFSLTDLVIPDSVSSIGEAAFKDCSGLKSVVLPRGITKIPSRLLSSCTNLTSVGIPANVTSIGDFAFYGCYRLNGVKIPAKVVSIAGSAFQYCGGMKNVELGSGLNSIGEYAFYSCGGLTNITIPASVTVIRNQAFFDCAGLTKSTFLGNGPTMGSQVFDQAAAGFKVYYYQGASGFTKPTWKGYPTAVLARSPEISLEQPIGSQLIDGVSKRSFGTVQAGKSGSPRKFTIINLGTADLTGLAVTKSGADSEDFTISAPVSTILTPGTTTTFLVTFKPTVAAARDAVIHIKSNDLNENPFDIHVAGMGVP
jgi:hypothetical protein